MADTILALQQLENIFYTITCQLLGLDPDDPASFDKVRIAWPTEGAPAWWINDDVVFLRVNTVSDGYTQQRDTEYTRDSIDLANKITSYVRTHLVKWTIYGPNSYENAETIRNGIYGAKSILKQNSLSLILDVPNFERLPELFSGRWWQRVDFSARFYEKVTRQTTVPYIKGTKIEIMTEKGVAKDANITP